MQRKLRYVGTDVGTDVGTFATNAIGAEAKISWGRRPALRR